MFLTLSQIRQSLDHLVNVHPFYGITFLVCKKRDLPVGSAVEIALDSENKDFLDKYYKPAPFSEWYYRVFRTSDKEKLWNKYDYASSGLQSVNTRTFGPAFIHEKNTDIWGWQPDYVETLRSLLYKKKLIPAFDLAVWLYRERDWPAGATAQTVLDTFVQEFNLTESELRALFDLSLKGAHEPARLLQGGVVTWEELREVTGDPHDAKPEEGGTLASLIIEGVGPAKRIEFHPAERLNLITGDNGLGKTFILECAWWALTGTWADQPGFPRSDARAKEPKITFQISGETRNPKPIAISYDWETNSWPSPDKRPTIPGLIVYARVDGSFAVYDPALKQQLSFNRERSQTTSLVFKRDEVWSGLDGKIEGLLRDWTKWQNKPDKYPFDIFVKVLHKLSPPDLGPLEPGEPVRLPGESREIPTLVHPYGAVPIMFESAGVRRIITLAYLMVWAWNEHKIHAGLARRDPERRMVVLIDEMEAHLHPEWQRAVLPSLLAVREELSSSLHAQFIVATHSPLVMASAEPIFNEEVDKLFHLDLNEVGNVIFRELQFVLYGPIDSWLTSEVFDLRQSRSREAEAAIERAKELQKQSDPRTDDVRSVSEELIKYLSADDEFWPRWLYFAETHGVDL